MMDSLEIMSIFRRPETPVSMSAADLRDPDDDPELHRLWSGAGHRRNVIEESWLSELLPAPEVSQEPRKSVTYERSCEVSPSCTTPDFDSDYEDNFFNILPCDLDGTKRPSTPVISLEPEPSLVQIGGIAPGEVPTSYVVPKPQNHEVIAVGTYVDPRIVPGFKYRVRPLDLSRPLFGGQALKLLAIGAGYAKRLTFEPQRSGLNNNSNYLWSDSWPLGLGFEIEVVSPGEKFTIQDANHQAIGTCEIIFNQRPQEETSHSVQCSKVEKWVRLRLLGKVEWFEDAPGAETTLPITGIAIAVKSRSGTAQVQKILNASAGHFRGLTLIPGVDRNCRRTTVYGEKIGDIPTQYTVTGLESYEMPVIGTYVDPRLAVGFHYRVRPAHSRRHLFGGRALRLLGIGAGHAKRITFQPDSLLGENGNLFWSDSWPEGFGFQIQAVFASMNFSVQNSEQEIGIASVFRADSAQIEESSGMDPRDGSLIKRVYIEVTCNVSFHARPGDDPQTMRVSGTAILSRPCSSTTAKLLRIENIGLDSQINLLFVIQQAKVTFYPI